MKTKIINKQKAKNVNIKNILLISIVSIILLLSIFMVAYKPKLATKTLGLRKISGTSLVLSALENLGEEPIELEKEKSIDTKTSTSEKNCIDGKCIQTAYSDLKYVYEDNQWKNVEDARSLKDSLNITYLEIDENYDVEVIDITPNNITVRIVSSFTGKIPVRILSPNKEKVKNYKDKDKLKENKDKVKFIKDSFDYVEYEENVQEGVSITRTYPYNFRRDILEVGENSTIIQTDSGAVSYETDLVLTWGGNTQNGDLIVVMVGVVNTNSVTSITDSQSNTYTKIADGTSDYVRGEIWYAKDITGGTTPSVTIATAESDDVTAIMREYSGMSADPLDKSAETLDADWLTSHTSGATATTTQADELVVGGYVGDANSGYTLGSGYSNLATQDGTDLWISVALEDKVVSSTGTQTATITSAEYIKGYMVVATFKETVEEEDTTPPYFTDIPANATLQMFNESLGVDFDATDETELDTFFINDTTNFQINSTGYLSNKTALSLGNYAINVSINDTSNNINWTNYLVTVIKNTNACQVLFNESSPLQYPKTFKAYTDCPSGFQMYRNGSIIANNSEQSLAIGTYNFTVTRNDTTNYVNIFDDEYFSVQDYALQINEPNTGNPKSVSGGDNISIFFDFLDLDSSNLTSGVTIGSAFIGGIESEILGGSDEEEILFRSNGDSYTAGSNPDTVTMQILPDTSYSILFNSKTDTDTVYSSGEWSDKAITNFKVFPHDDGAGAETCNYMWATIPYGYYNLGDGEYIECGNVGSPTGAGGTATLDTEVLSSDYSVICSTAPNGINFGRCSLDGNTANRTSSSFGYQIDNNAGTPYDPASMDYCVFSHGEYIINNSVLVKSGITTQSSGTFNITFSSNFPDNNYVVFLTHDEDDNGDACACETTIISTNSFTATCEDDGGSTTSCNGDKIDWVAFTLGNYNLTYGGSGQQFAYVTDVGWNVNVTVPEFESGLKDLFVNATYSGSTKDDTESNAIDYGGGDSCTYTSGDWQVDCSDNCVISDEVNLGGNNILLHGAGKFDIRNTVRNYNQIMLFDPSTCDINIFAGGSISKQ